jgi:hypothetical protein
MKEKSKGKSQKYGAADAADKKRKSKSHFSLSSSQSDT